MQEYKVRNSLLLMEMIPTKQPFVDEDDAEIGTITKHARTQDETARLLPTELILKAASR